MQLEPTSILHILQDKGVEKLCHANSVRSCVTFLEAGGLLSRGDVEQLGLDQTPQLTDQLDKRFGIWHDVFVDGVDIHSRAKRRNQYGPVLFGLNLGLFEWDELPPIWITRDNPCRWHDGQSDEERYYQSPAEFAEEYHFGDFAMMMTLRARDVLIPFERFLDRIVVDNPHRTLGRHDLFEGALRAISASVRGSRLARPGLVVGRRCGLGCSCNADYQAMSVDDVRANFLPLP